MYVCGSGCTCVGSVSACVCAYMWRPGDDPGYHSSGTVYQFLYICLVWFGWFCEIESFIGLKLNWSRLAGPAGALPVFQSPALALQVFSATPKLMLACRRCTKRLIFLALQKYESLNKKNFFLDRISLISQTDLDFMSLLRCDYRCVASFLAQKNNF